MKKLLFISMLFLSNAVWAQNTDTMGSSVIVHKDPRIDLLIKKQSGINIATKKQYGRTMRGYRLLIIKTNQRDEAIAAKTKVYTNFPELKAYLIYQAPFFHLRAGDFKTRDEAAKFQKQMSTLFPHGVFIVNDTIEIKPEKADEESE